jgi:hypothetical protein
MLRHFGAFRAVFVTVAVALLIVPAGYAVYYFDDGSTGIYCYPPGAATVSGYNSWKVNVTVMKAVCVSGTNPQMGLTYNRSDGTQYPYKWASCNCTNLYQGTEFVDSRDVSYGRAVCKANSGNGGGIWVDYCWTSAT